MSATVKAAARAAAARLAGDKSSGGGKGGVAPGGLRSVTVVTSGGGGGSGSAGGGNSSRRIERDIFAARPSRGQALGVSAGGYDVFPETGDFETYDSDEVGDGCMLLLEYRIEFLGELNYGTSIPALSGV